MKVPNLVMAATVFVALYATARLFFGPSTSLPAQP